MAIIKQYNKKTGITYVYESHSYWDKEKKQHRSNRKLIGKIDPETGEVVPTRKRTNNSDGTDPARVRELEAQAAKKDAELQKLRDTVSALEKELKEKEHIIDTIRALVNP